MILDLETYTLVHVVLSLIGIGSGLIVLFGMLSAKPMGGWTALFLLTTVATSATGFGFPFHQFLPSHAVGVLSLVVLAVASYARYARHMAGAWRWIYVLTAVAALYLNSFVGVVQAFLKVPALHDLAPTQAEPPFLIAQCTLLALFVVLAIVAVIRFRLDPTRPALRAA
jgi:hypothetical protein